MKTTHYSLPAALGASRIRLASAARRGFSLVEMLTVIAIIGILGIAIGGAFSGNSGSAAAMNNAQRSVAGLFQMARAQAVMKGVPTAVIFYRRASDSSNNDASKHLRFMGIVYQDGSTWKPLNRGTYLPKGVYYVPPSGSAFGSSGNLSVGSSDNSLDENMSVAFPVPGATADRWYAYKFEKNGNLSGQNTYVLLAPSEIMGPPADGTPTLNTDVMAEQMVGIAVRKTGGTVSFEGFNSSAITNFEGGN